MKILLQNTTFYPHIGGIENYLYYVSKQLLKLGHEPVIICGRLPRSLPSKEILEGIRIVRYQLPLIPRPLKVFWPFFEARAARKFLADFLKKEKFDAVWCRYFSLLWPTVIACPDIPVIYIQSAISPLYRQRASEKLKKIYRFGYILGAYPAAFLEKKGMMKCSKIITLSQMRMRESIDYYGLPFQKYEVVHPGIDLTHFHPRKKDKFLCEELRLSLETKVILTVSRLSAEKNLDHLIKAFLLVNSKLKDSVLIIAGDGNDRERLKKLAKELRIAQRVKFVGERKDVEKFYTIADVFVLPSRYEGFGQVLLEAMAFGVPVIGLKADYPKVIVANEEIIINGKTGFLVDPYLVEDLAFRIEQILQDDNLKKQQGENARKLCEERYLWSDNVLILLKITKDLMAQ